MRYNFTHFIYGFIIASISLTGICVKAEDKFTVGYIENVRIYPGSLWIKAKLDTGARNSSLHVSNMKRFKKNDTSWVRFEVTNWKGKKITIEKEIVRTAKIKQHGKKADKRPVIQLGMCLGGIYKKVEVNLEDRSNYIYQLLVGRSFLKGSFLVDSSKIFTQKGICPEINGYE